MTVPRLESPLTTRELLVAVKNALIAPSAPLAEAGDDHVSPHPEPPSTVWQQIASIYQFDNRAVAGETFTLKGYEHWWIHSPSRTRPALEQTVREEYSWQRQTVSIHGQALIKRESDSDLDSEMTYSRSRDYIQRKGEEVSLFFIDRDSRIALREELGDNSYFPPQNARCSFYWAQVGEMYMYQSVLEVGLLRSV